MAWIRSFNAERVGLCYNLFSMSNDNSTMNQTQMTLTPTTSQSLLDDLHENLESPRIDEFASIYEPVMRRYARQAMARLRGGLCEADCDDLVQEAFISVRQALLKFRYDKAKGRFRNYLSIAIRNLAFKFASRSAAMKRVDPADLDSFEAPQGGDGAHDDRETMLAIWSVAYALVLGKRNFSPNTQAIFRSHVLDGIPVEDVAEEFKTSVGAVYQIKDRILRAVRAEIDSARSPGAGLDELYGELLRRSGPRNGR